nr:EOG090X0BTB [Triops cancriformis]
MFSQISRIQNSSFSELILNCISRSLIPELPSSPADVEVMRIFLILPLYQEFLHAKQHELLQVPFAAAILRLPTPAGKILAAFQNLKQSEAYEQVAAEAAASLPPEENESTESNGAKITYKANSIVVSPRQRGNPLLKSIRNVAWEYGDIVPDYVMGQTTCALFLSLRYHNLNPNYIYDRLKSLGKQYELRILLVQVDIKDPHHPLKELTKICLLADLTLMVAWSPEEAGKMIETYKIFEHKPPDLIMEKPDTNSSAKVVDALTTIKSVNRTDAATLLSNFHTLANILQASEEDLSLCPGIGPLKASRLYRVLHEDFKKGKSESPRKSFTAVAEDAKSND